MAKKKARKKNPPKPNAPKKSRNKASSQAGTARQAAASRRTPKAAARTRRVSKPRMSATTSWALLVGAAVAILGLVVFFAIRDQADTGTGEVATGGNGFDLPALTDAADPDGDGRTTLDQFEGTPTVVNFFASWCTACNEELPDFTALADQFEGEIDFVFINSQETGDWEDMADDHGLKDYPIITDIGPNRSRLYLAAGGTGGMPITVFYDANGTRLFTNQGQMNAATVSSTLSQYGLLPSDEAG